ncbi:MAG: CoA-binding protein, partial [Thermodesulfobacteriota bacterium]|nr:CoA-binding protein [Thermodesulfobacteriota bacterium]
MVWDADFNRAFNPKAIAVVGVSAIDPDSLPKGRFLGGLGFVQNLKERGFSGRIYPINPKAKEIAGLKVYPNVASVPEPVDLVVVAVPAKALASVFEDCIAANAKNIHVFTAGFEETGEEEGKRLGQEIKEIAQRGGLRIVGPNCMGLYVPSARLAMWHEGCTQGGAVAFLSQSGRIAQDYVEYAQGCGIKFSKVISYGNALTLDCTDFLEYLAHDPETRIIGMYLEGLKDGRRLTEQIKKINSDKPVIIWKGGLTEPGSRAVSSHTASMAGEMA